MKTVLLYGSNTWTLTHLLMKKLDGAYTKMLRVVKSITWQQRITNDALYGGLPRITTTIKEKRLRFSGHCWRSKNEIVHDLILWELKHGTRRSGRPPLTFTDQLENDTGISREQLPPAMEDRDGWRRLIMSV